MAVFDRFHWLERTDPRSAISARTISNGTLSESSATFSIDIPRHLLDDGLG